MTKKYTLDEVYQSDDMFVIVDFLEDKANASAIYDQLLSLDEEKAESFAYHCLDVVFDSVKDNPEKNCKKANNLLLDKEAMSVLSSCFYDNHDFVSLMKKINAVYSELAANGNEDAYCYVKEIISRDDQSHKKVLTLFNQISCPENIRESDIWTSEGQCKLSIKKEKDKNRFHLLNKISELKTVDDLCVFLDKTLPRDSFSYHEGERNEEIFRATMNAFVEIGDAKALECILCDEWFQGELRRLIYNWEGKGADIFISGFEGLMQKEKSAGAIYSLLISDDNRIDDFYLTFHCLDIEQQMPLLESAMNILKDEEQLRVMGFSDRFWKTVGRSSSEKQENFISNYVPPLVKSEEIVPHMKEWGLEMTKNKLSYNDGKNKDLLRLFNHEMCRAAMEGFLAAKDFITKDVGEEDFDTAVPIFVEKVGFKVQ